MMSLPAEGSTMQIIPKRVPNIKPFQDTSLYFQTFKTIVSLMVTKEALKPRGVNQEFYAQMQI